MDVMAKRLGVNKNTLGDYERGKHLPDVDFLAQSAGQTESSFTDLLALRLRDSPVEGADGAPQDFTYETTVSDEPGPSVAVLGLAECGLNGWYREGPMAVRAARPGDLHDPDAFAVMAIGTSMQPAGIFDGFLCFCSPRDRHDEGDAVFIEGADGTSSIKIYGGKSRGWIILTGYLPPDENGRQDPYNEKVRHDHVRKVATVIYVKRKL